MGSPNLNNEPEMVRIQTKDDEIKEFKYKTEEHDHEKTLKPPKIVTDFYQKKYKYLYEKEVLIFSTDILLGSGSAITTSTLSKLNPSIGNLLTSSRALLPSSAILITNGYLSSLKIG